jgi:hypothetical protein
MRGACIKRSRGFRPSVRLNTVDSLPSRHHGYNSSAVIIPLAVALVEYFLQVTSSGRAGSRVLWKWNEAGIRTAQTGLLSCHGGRKQPSEKAQLKLALDVRDQDFTWHLLGNRCHRRRAGRRRVRLDHGMRAACIPPGQCGLVVGGMPQAAPCPRLPTGGDRRGQLSQRVCCWSAKSGLRR